MKQGTWTDQQWQAITESGCDLLVAAAAGSGKTAVLVERIIQMITREKNPVDIDRLLVVTFTSAAAAEMRERIGTAIDRELEKNPSNEHLRSQKILLHRSRITTIHSFCMQVVREYYQKVDMDPAFRVADEAEISLLKSEVLEAVFESYYSRDTENDAAFFSLVESYGENTKDRKLKELVLSIYTFVQSNPFPNAWMNEMAERYHLGEGQKLEGSFWWELLLEETNFVLTGLLDYIHLALEEANRPDGAEEYVPTLLQDKKNLTAVLDALQQGWQASYEAVQVLQFPTLGRKKKETSPETADKIKYLRELVKKGFASLKESCFFQPPEAMAEDFIQLYPVIQALVGLVQDFSQAYQQAKKEKMIVDFNDLEHFCLEILLEEGSTVTNPIASKEAIQLQDSFEEVLTDEYQDSNLVQEMILSVVSKDSRQEPNRFMVGDVKQSIYRFRLARPELFMEKYDTYGKDNSQSKRIDLFQNFRSRENVLAGINFLFCQLMTKNLGDVVYDEKAALYPGADFPEPASSDILYGGDVELTVLDLSSSAMEDTDMEELAELSNMEAEATWIADRIFEMTAGEQVFQVLDKKSRQYRPVTYGDIVVLLRAPSRWSQTMTEILASHGIPSYAEGTSGYYDTLEVTAALDLLRVIDNPRQDIPLLGVLHSPVFHFTAEELIQMKKESGKKEFYDCLLDCAAQESSSLCREKAASFLERLQGWRKLASFTPISRLLLRLYQETGYFDYVGGLPQGALRQANLSMLVDKAIAYENSSYAGLFHFVRYIEKIKQMKNTESGTAKLLGENENLVRVMSIHKSKGLEFPVVFVGGLGKNFNKTDLTKPVLLHQDLGFGSVYVDYQNRVTYPTIARSFVAKRMEKETLSEELRVLYVAFTRAKEKLILVGGVRNLEKELMKWTLYSNHESLALPYYGLMQAKNYLDWIMPALARHKDGRILNVKAGTVVYRENQSVYEDPSKWNLRILSRGDLTNGQKPVHNEATGLSEALEQWSSHMEQREETNPFLAWLSWEYPHGKSISIPANLSISELKRIYQKQQGQEEEPNYYEPISALKKPDFVKGQKPLTAAQKGTVMHTVLERMDFHRRYTLEEIGEIVKCLVREGILTAEEGKAVKIGQIYRFFQHPIYERILASGRVKKESPFTITLKAEEVYGKMDGENAQEEILLHGIIDCYFYEDGQIVLVDYKTDYVPNGDASIIAEKYKLQLSLYGKALERITEKKVKESYLFLLSTGQSVKMEI